MPVCDYCGEQVRALKNHVRMSSGNGHGQSGQYPEDFDAGGTQRRAAGGVGDRDAPGDESTSGTDGTAERGREAVDMTPEEFDDAIEAAREAAYQDGYEDGYEQGRADERREGSEESDGGETESLPCCGNEVPADELPDGGAKIRCEECGEVLMLTP